MQLTVLLIVCLYASTNFNNALILNERPYEFGYSIEGNQHRYEKKDENGIIMGEFGFVTADGVYHVTVYATDENGNFRIVSMKNIKIFGKSTDDMSKISTTNVTKKMLKKNIEKKNLAATTKTSSKSYVMSCSSCLIPQTSQVNQNANGMPYSTNGQDNDFTMKNMQTSKTDEFKKNDLPPPKGRTSSSSSGLFKPLSKTITNVIGGSKASKDQATFKLGNDYKDSKLEMNNVKKLDQKYKNNNNNYPKIDASNTVKQPQQQLSSSAGYNHASSIPDSNRETPSKKLIGKGVGGLLYVFNYTVGYHGHHEKGDFEGVKDGGYYFISRDGLNRTVDYLANEFGYQPFIENNRINDKNIPKKETEKNAGLKGYEFKWFNRNI